MGKVFSWGEIVNGLVPETEQLYKVKEQAYTKISESVGESYIYGAKFFGSVAKNDNKMNIRSDIDLLILLSGRNAGLFELKRDFRDIYQQTGIKLRPIVIRGIDLAQNGIHTIDSLFYKRLSLVEPSNNVVGRDPLKIIKPFSIDTTSLVNFYQVHKMQRFDKAYFDYGKLDYFSLQRALESPVNMGRMVLSLLKREEGG